MYPPQGFAALLKEALVVYKGTTTSAGGASGATLVCSALAAKADWNGNQIIVTSGDYEGQARDINGKTNNATGTVTPANAFGGVIVEGVTFVITGIRTVPAEVAECLAILESDSRRILSTALTAPTVNSLTKFVASGGTALGTTLGASKSLIDAIGADGVDTLTHDFSEEGIMQYLHGTHETTYILLVIPEAVASISTHNTAIKTSLEKLGRVIVITQADALSYPDFNTYTLCVLGSNNGTAWTTSNLAHIKDISDMPTVCCDSVSAAYLEMGTANANVTGTKVLNGVANIEGSIVGVGLHGRTGLAVGAQDIADANTTFASLDMSDADITEVYYGYETSDDNAHVLLGKIRYIQPDGTIGVDEEGEEIPGSRYFYGPAYSYNDLNTLGQDAFEILVLGFIHSKTIGHSIAISGEIRSLEKVLFGNLKNKFSNSNPLAKFIGTGGTGLGQPLPASTSLIDLLGDFTGPHDGAEQDDNVKASLDLLHTHAGEKSVGKLQIATTTEDLNQGIGSYDLLTGTTQSVILEKLTIRMPTEAASAPLTSISIQTDDVTPSVIINTTDGAVANLTSEAQLSWTGAIEIPVGTKIQLSIAGGAHGSTYTTTIIAQCRAVVSGGYLV